MSEYKRTPLSEYHMTLSSQDEGEATFSKKRPLVGHISGKRLRGRWFIMDTLGEPKAGVIINELVMLDACLQRRLNQPPEDRRALTVVLDNSDNSEAQQQLAQCDSDCLQEVIAPFATQEQPQKLHTQPQRQHQYQLQLQKTLKTSVNLQLPDPDSLIFEALVCPILQLEDEKSLASRDKRLVGLEQVVRGMHACMYIQCHKLSVVL